MCSVVSFPLYFIHKFIVLGSTTYLMFKKQLERNLSSLEQTLERSTKTEIVMFIQYNLKKCKKNCYKGHPFSAFKNHLRQRGEGGLRYLFNTLYKEF